MSVVRLRVRKAENPYVMLDKTSLNDSRLSFRAKGIHAYLISKPDDWEVRVKQLMKESPREGRDAILSALQELEIYGYLGRGKKRDARGRLLGIETIVYETPGLADFTGNGKPGPGKPGTGKPYPGFPELTNKEAFTQNSFELMKEKTPPKPPPKEGAHQAQVKISQRRKRRHESETHEALKAWRDEKVRERDACRQTTLTSLQP
jgi:hypothetical protein